MQPYQPHWRQKRTTLNDKELQEAVQVSTGKHSAFLKTPLTLHDTFTFLSYTAIIISQGEDDEKYSLLAITLGVTTLFASDGATLYKTCATCHGEKGEKQR